LGAIRCRSSPVALYACIEQADSVTVLHGQPWQATGLGLR
jgi:hypothetical protein